MKRIPAMIFCMIMVLVACGPGVAFDLDALDQVAVSMPKSTVLSLLGKPDETGKRKDGLELHIYTANSESPMMGAGCIYGENQLLVGQSFIFPGEMANRAAEKLQQGGFTLTEQQGDAFRLLGKDDDTGQPLVVQVLQVDGLTIVMTFEKGFYDRLAK